VSAVVVPLACSKVVLGGQVPPVGEETERVTVVVWLLAQVIVPPEARDAAGSAVDAPPVLPVHPDNVTVDVMFPVRVEHLMPVNAKAGVANAPLMPITDIETAAAATPIRVNRL
jgi:hypothetical protein